MSGRKEYAGIDGFRLAAAFLIVAIHTAPLEGISLTADYLITYCAGRIAVPFFLMTTGFFILSGCRDRHSKGLFSFLGRTGLMYIGCTLLYLPLTVYAGNLPKGWGGWAGWILMEGTFYHLWYLPAVIIGCLLTAGLMRVLPSRAVGIVVLLLYLIGLLGDSYYGAIYGWEPLRSFYDVIFSLSGYTRNGIFYAPLFLWIGASLGRTGEREASQRHLESGCYWAAFSIFFLLMLAEGFVTWSFGWQRHNSMYLLLPAVSYFLMRGLLRVKGRSPSILRRLSMWIYLLHPLCIVGVRGAAKLVKLQNLLVENSLIFYLLVCISSLALAVILEKLRKLRKRA